MTTLRQRITRSLDARTHKGVELGPYGIEIERDLRVPMDDGVELLGDLIRPIGSVDPGLPTIVMRSPYGRRGPFGGTARALAYDGFPVFVQSCRGTWGSQGRFSPQIDEQRDGIATLRWVRRQPWFSGKLATFGPSYLGFTQWAVAGKLQRDEPETAQDALVLHITMPDFGAITWDNGAYSLRNALGWTRMMDRMRRGPFALIGMAFPDPKLERAFDVLPLSAGDSAVIGAPNHWYQDWVAHEKLTDEFWTQQSHTASVADVTAPVAMLTGWYDIFLPWQLRTYAQLVAAGNQPWLTVGPWGHTSREMGIPAHTETIGFLREVFTDAAAGRTAPVRAFLTGADQWHDLTAWPPPGSEAQDWFLHEGGGFGIEAPAGGTTRYRYDPVDATPAVGGPSLTPDTLPVDNAAHEQRADVAVFRGEVLAEPVTIAGEPVARVRVRSSATSFDVFVRITDVHPDGRVLTVCDGIRRIGSIGTTATDPAPDADGFREVDVTLWPAFHRFAPGHRIGVQISSGAHPRYARNPGTGEAAAVAASVVVAEQEIAHDGISASRLSLPMWAS
ncbi:CocE/NonD family hydrolase [Microbacterium sp. 2FI]|uniref:CocE/NonD family hydrolase n=1 Tax=Microbacterium sp. 2FI TaxID=2502193 RepID=UPI0010F485B5|nr:CocE/NonD family hydrolase [Microbacterium sp. 2FI]